MLKLSARLSGTDGLKCCCLAPVLEFSSRSGSRSICGWAEFSTSVPAQHRYKTRTQVANNVLGGPFTYVVTLGPAPDGTDQGTACGSFYQTTVWRDGEFVLEYVWADHPFETVPPNYIPAGGDPGHYVGFEYISTTEARLKYVVAVSGGEFVYGYDYYTLSDEDTIESAIADAEARLASASWSEWDALGSPVSASVDVPGVSATRIACRYRVGIVGGVAGQSYDVAVDYSAGGVLVATANHTVVAQESPDDWPVFEMPMQAGLFLVPSNPRIVVTP